MIIDVNNIEIIMIYSKTAVLSIAAIYNLICISYSGWLLCQHVIYIR